MPRLNDSNSGGSLNNLAKLLLIGDGKIGKSWFAGLAAEQGFNLLYMDGDVARQTLGHRDFPQAAKDHIYLMSVGDKLAHGALNYDFAENFRTFTSTNRFVWDDTNSAVVARKSDTEESEVWEIFPAKMDHTVVWVIDSWTSLVNSVLLWAARSNGVDLQDTDTSKMRPVYQAAGNKLTQFLIMIQRVPCHVICIAHLDEYAKYEKPVGIKVKDAKEGENKLLWTKLIPKSCSKPHSLTMSKYFTDVAWMETNRMGDQRLLNFKISEERISGGHFNDIKKIEEYSFAKLVEQIGGVVPSEHAPTDHWLKIHSRGEYQQPESGAGKVLGGNGEGGSATKAVPVKKGFGTLAGMKKPA